MVLLARRKGFVRVLAHPSRTVKGRGRKNTHAHMVETGGRRHRVRGHPPGRRAPDGGHRERGRDPHARHRQDHHEPDGIGRHDVSKGARQRRLRIPEHEEPATLLHRHRPQPQPVDQQRTGRRPRQMVRHPRRTGHDQIRLVQHPDTGRHVRTARERRRTPEGHRRNHPDGRTVRKPERHRDLPGHRHHARHALQDRARPREPLQNPPRPDAGHGRRARPRAARRNDPHQLEQVRRQDRREVHHHRHALDQPVRQPVQQGRLQPLRRLLHDPRRPVRHPVHVQAGIRREHDQRQPARQHRVHPGVQTRLRQERRNRPDPERHRHRQTRQNQCHGRREERRGHERKPAGPSGQW